MYIVPWGVHFVGMGMILQTRYMKLLLTSLANTYLTLRCLGMYQVL